MADYTTGKELLSAYRANINPDIQKKLRKIDDINEKYKLTPGTETDFNTAATFYMYAQVKNSEAIDSMETDLSRVLGSALMDYHKTYIGDSKLHTLLSAINRYNAEINALYDTSDSKNAIRILKNIYGIDPSDFSITEGSYAHRALLEIKNNYYNKILPRLELSELITRVREQTATIGSTNNSNLVNTTSSAHKTFTSNLGILFNELKKSTTVISAPKIKYTISGGDYSGELIIELKNNKLYFDITKNNTTTELIYNPNPRDNETVLTPSTNTSGVNWFYLLQMLNDLMFLENGAPRALNIDAILLSKNKEITNGNIRYKLEYTSEPVGIGEEKYTFSTYEQQYLLFVTFYYLYKKIYKNLDGLHIKNFNNIDLSQQTAVEIANDTTDLLVLNKDNCETIVELNDGIGGTVGTKLVANEWDIYNKIDVDLSDTVHSTVKIKVGYLKDPYVSLGGRNTTESIKSYVFSGHRPASDIVELSNLIVADPGTVRNIVETEQLAKDGIPAGFFVYPEVRKSYAMLDIKNLYIYLKQMYARTGANDARRIGMIECGVEYSGSANTVVFDDIKNTNMFSKMSHNDSSIYIYEDKTLDLYAKLANTEDYDLNEMLIENLSCDQDFSKEYSVMLNSFKIYYEFNEPTVNVIDKSIDDIKSIEKRYASDVEAYFAMNYYNANYFELNNLLIDTTSETFTELNELFDKRYYDYSDDNTDLTEEEYNASFNAKKKDNGLIPGSNDKFTTVSISILYKEFNPIIRDLTQANIQNRLIAEYCNSVSDNILNSKLYDYITDPKKIEKIEAIPADNGHIFVNLHTNSFIVRNSVADDIISYIAGDIINYGDSAQAKDEIQMLLNIYKETRDYFYKVLLNKAFVLEDQYTLFKQLYIKAYSIERFMSSRLTNLTEIKYYTAEDCRNFLVSYGLKTLSDQVDSANFADSITYKKRIIANYNNLMSMKGSRAIIDEFFKLFNYDTTEIVIYKYLLYKNEQFKKELVNNTDYEWKASNEASSLNEILRFIPIDYNSKNSIYSIKNNSKKSKKYEEFLNKDVYWDENELTPQIINDLFESPVNTKYMGIDLKKDIYMSYIKSKYTLSLIEYLYNQFDTKFGANKSYLDHIKVSLSTNEDGSSDGNDDDGYSIKDVFNAIRYLFSLYIALSDKTNINANEASYRGGQHTPYYFYGINPNANIDEFVFKNTYLTKDLVKDLFTANYASYSTEMYKNKSIAYYAEGLYRVPAKMTKDITSRTTVKDLLFGQDAPMPMTSEGYLIPLRTETNKIATTTFDTHAYDTISYATGEIFTNDSESADFNSEENSSMDAISTAFKSISLINFLNTLSVPQNTREVTENNAKFKAVYYFEKFANSASIYPANLNELGNIDEPEVELKFPERSNFYTCLFEKVLQFPLNYLDGEYSVAKSMNYTHDTREILREIFDKFFVINGSDNDDVIGYLNAINYDPVDGNTSIEFGNTAYIDKVYTNNDVLIFLEDTTHVLLNVDNSHYRYVLNGSIEDTISAIADRIISLCDIIATAAEQYQLLKLDLQFGESINNFFDFIKTCVNFFISYTSMLYESNLILKIETPNEKVPLTYKIYDSLEQKQDEYFYYDEDVLVDEIIDQ